jgi:hypothetical protein
LGRARTAGAGPQGEAQLSASESPLAPPPGRSPEAYWLRAGSRRWFHGRPRQAGSGHQRADRRGLGLVVLGVAVVDGLLVGVLRPAIDEASSVSVSRTRRRPADAPRAPSASSRWVPAQSAMEAASWPGVELGPERGARATPSGCVPRELDDRGPGPPPGAWESPPSGDRTRAVLAAC